MGSNLNSTHAAKIKNYPFLSTESYSEIPIIMPFQIISNKLKLITYEKKASRDYNF